MSSTLHFSREAEPAVVEPIGVVAESSLRFDSALPVDAALADGAARDSTLAVLAELTLLRVRQRDEESTALDPTSGSRDVSLRFHDSSGNAELWGDTESSAFGAGRWEVIPDLYLRSGQVHDAGYESLDYADLYAELGFDLTSNTGISLRYERLRQGLGSTREGEQVDADALYLQFELRF